MNVNEHIIRRIKVQVLTGSRAQPFQLRNRIENLCASMLPSRLESILSRIDGTAVIELPSIQLKVSGEDWMQLEAEILDECCYQIEKLLKESFLHFQSTSPKEKTIIHSAESVFFYFL